MSPFPLCLRQPLPSTGSGSGTIRAARQVQAAVVVMRRWLSLSKPPAPDRRIVYFNEQTAIRSAILPRGEWMMKFVWGRALRYFKRSPACALRLSEFSGSLVRKADFTSTFLRQFEGVLEGGIEEGQFRSRQRPDVVG